MWIAIPTWPTIWKFQFALAALATLSGLSPRRFPLREPPRHLGRSSSADGGYAGRAHSVYTGSVRTSMAFVPGSSFLASFCDGWQGCR
jgi:hypothetical protein